jgi:sigma-E factor negative regulatory protein RseA
MKYVESELTHQQENWSALHDGELSASEAAVLVHASLDDESLMLQWRSMSTIASVLRQQQGSAAVAHQATAGAAASGAMQLNRAMVSTSDERLVASQAADRSPAANDGVFRWKMVAGLAAFSALGSLVWALVGQAGDKAGLHNPVLAQNQNAPVVNASGQSLISVGGQVAGQDVTMIRDPRLDELLAAHKQFGGISALQQPAGSLRSVALGGLAPSGVAQGGSRP